MQNQGPPYQGPVNHGAFPDHTYNNQMGSHCPPSGYQPYVNGPYPVGNPRGHHYSNHQMQQGPPTNHQHQYRGNYAPPPGQYGHPPNQDMYRNHHAAYPRGNARNMHNKTAWVDNSSADMMPSYNHAQSHPQMMNNSAPMNVSSMRSPPHLASVPSPGSQHYRQMQSPGHSPQTWSQVQASSPGMHPVARTTPSPLSSHARSPGHGQPFSPSATHMPSNVNMTPHPIPSVVPENPQSAQMCNQGMSNVMPSGPLHSLQKMVMLEQNSSDPLQPNCDLTSDSNCDPLPVCAPIAPAAVAAIPLSDQNDELKDSFSTYYNLDENCLESEPHSTPPYKSMEFPNNAPSTNVSHPPQALNSNDNLLSDGPMLPQQNNPLPEPTTNFILKDDDNSRSTNDLQNGPKFTSETESITETDLEVPTLPICVPMLENLTASDDCQTSSSEVAAQVTKCTDNSTQNDKNALCDEASCHSTSTNEFNENESSSSQIISSTSVDPLIADNLQETNMITNQSNVVENVSVQGEMPATIQQIEEEIMDSAVSSVDKSSLNTVSVRTFRSTTSVACSDSTITSNSVVCLGKSRINTSDITRNPVKVVIHRIRTNSTNDTWHVPTTNSNMADKLNTLQNVVFNDVRKNCSTPRPSKIGPQIIMLSPAMSKKKFGTNSDEVNDIKQVHETDSVTVPNQSGDTKNTSKKSPPKRRLPRKGAKNSNPKSLNKIPKKRGRPFGALTKAKAAVVKRRRRQKNAPKRHLEDEVPEQAAVKPKKMKPFLGPYLRVTGTKLNPTSITVVNVAVKEEEKCKLPRTKASDGSSTKMPRVGHTSTLSPHYDAFNRDRSWLCVFCHKGSHSSCLGDLYGPYYVNNNSSQSNSSEDHPTSRGIRSKRRKSDGSFVESAKTPQLQKKATKQAAKIAEHVETPGPSRNVSQKDNDSSSDVKEVWIHEDCAVWCQGISLMGSQMFGLDEAIQDSKDNICSICKMAGATLGCWCKGCKEQYHFGCAKEKGCKLDIEIFSLFCPKHQDKSNSAKQRRCSAQSL